MASKKPDCVRSTRVSKIKISEKRAKAVILNPNNDEYDVTRFDGCVVNNEVAADFLVSKTKVGDLIVELKGKNVKHAVEQIIATATFLRKNSMSEGRLGALIVCNEFPKANTMVQLLKLELKNKFDCPLRVSTENPEVEFLPLLGKKELIASKGRDKSAQLAK
ncbi:hypothetical protein [Burkholderia gladioli]|uniref:hypothetical protein n=1 Tax=Burkholderia gladioli TaxID=28095 RepID=UPI0016403D33|nr:hypothetical protein [Burkholderia gladioli]